MSAIAQRFEAVRKAFEADGFRVVKVRDPATGADVDYLERGGRFGCLAEHRTAINRKTGAHKRAYYVEGSNYLMGWFMGALAEPEVKLMAVDYSDNVIADFFNLKRMMKSKCRLVKWFKAKLVEKITLRSMASMRDVPCEYVEELKGLVDGCFDANPGTEVTFERLWGLNYGVDTLLALFYTGKILRRKFLPGAVKVPIFCNAFFISGEAAGGGESFFGRDFMFPTAGVYQDAACIVVQRPDPLDGADRRPFASQTAPGIIGSIVAMNDLGLGIGIDMNPSSYCAPERPGFNGMGLNRDVVQYCADKGAAVERIRRTQRGTSWFYPVGDASGDSCVVEAGRTPRPGEAFPGRKVAPKYFRKRLPSNEELLAEYGVEEPRDGIEPRGRGYRYPAKLLEDYNGRLFKAFNRKLSFRYRLVLRELGAWFQRVLNLWYAGRPLAMLVDLGRAFLAKAVYKPWQNGELGSYCKDVNDWCLPGPFYFAPQRERRNDVVLVSNHCITPHMKMQTMTEWLLLLTCGNQVDFQWRYDTLNREILGAVRDAGGQGVGAGAAWELIDFLDPYRKAPWPNHGDYYNPGGARKWVKVGGSVNLLELKAGRMTSLWGYYGDESVTITLPEYLA